MCLRGKRSGNGTCLQIVANRWEDGRSRQRAIATLGPLDEVRASGQIDRLAQSAAGFCEALLVLDGHGASPSARIERNGPALMFERLWHETGCQAVIEDLLADRH